MHDQLEKPRITLTTKKRDKIGNQISTLGSAGSIVEANTLETIATRWKLHLTIYHRSEGKYKR